MVKNDYELEKKSIDQLERGLCNIEGELEGVQLEYGYSSQDWQDRKPELFKMQNQIVKELKHRGVKLKMDKNGIINICK